MSKEKSKDLESNFDRLEKIIAELESEEVDIEKSIKKFREGAEILKACQKKLDEVKNQFIEIKEELEELNN